MRDVVIVSGTRTPVGSFGGSLKSTPVVDLGALVLKETLKKAGLRPAASEQLTRFEPDALKGEGLTDLEKEGYDYDDTLQPVQIDEVIMGNVVGAGQGQNIARQAMIRAGISKETGAFTINKLCASGMKAVALAAQAICHGEAEVVLAGGMENMSRIPYAVQTARWGARMGDTGLIDLLTYDGLQESFYGYHMGMTAENIAARYDISREAQDSLGALSHSRARQAIETGLFEEEILPIVTKTRKGDVVFNIDERPMDTTVEKMARLRPVFKKDGTVTAGNASGINDAAAAVLLVSRKKAEALGLEPLVEIKAFAAGGLDPAYMGLGPVPAVRKVLQRTGMAIGDIDMIELNEAFASQAIACCRELNLPEERPNELGSGISIGHPIGCTGARQMVTAIHQMQRKQYASGLISMCIGGGMGASMILESIR